jgi:adenylate cyclase
MAIEIERKFLVNGDGWRLHVTRSKRIEQAYLAITAKLSIRVRIVDDVDAMLTIKSQGASTLRQEFEYKIPLSDARALVELRVGILLTKVRHIARIDGLDWEIDEFGGKNASLVMAEIELTSAEQQIDLPDWLGHEVSDDMRYANSSLALRPFG